MIQRLLTALILIASCQSLQAEAISIDVIVAIVGEDIITRNELSARKKLAVVEINQTRREVPNDDILSRQVLNLMIDNSVLG
ncbi:MAG: hypothetical protein ACI845_004373, partial [Gammaproteobacteria bacterium]